MWLNTKPFHIYVASPRITVQPLSPDVIRRNKRNVFVFNITATGVGEIYYLWQKYNSFDDSWIPVSSRAMNDTLSKLDFSIITEEDEGIYHCIVSNYDGSVTSDNATITVFGKYIPRLACDDELDGQEK